MPDVFVAGSLRHAPTEWRSIYEKIGQVVRKTGHTVHIPHIDTAREADAPIESVHDPNLDLPTRARVFKKNFEKIRESKLLIAEVTKPSIGTGVEIGFALQLNKPIICLAHKDSDVTSMVLGPARLGLLKMIRYETEEEALTRLEDLLNSFKKNGSRLL